MLDFDFTPAYDKMDGNDFYSNDISVEYIQCVEEGLNIEQYKPLFDEIASMPFSQEREDKADELFKLICKTPLKKDYPYNEPSDYESIIALCDCKNISAKQTNDIKSKISGAWYGRIAGCMLGKTVEGIRSKELHTLLKATDNYPMCRYIKKSECISPKFNNFDYNLKSRPAADDIKYMPADDDTNYLALAQKLISEKGKDFTSLDVIDNWVKSQPKTAYFTAERVALINRIKGYMPPVSAVYKNPFREYIGAHIRVDYYGYINAGNPALAAEMAFRDASISHTKNGIYSAMFVAAMIAVSPVSNSLEEIIKTGLCFVPTTSRLYHYLNEIIKMHEDGFTYNECFDRIHEWYDEKTGYGWCHAIPNACIVVTALLYGNNDYRKSVCMAVETAFDTDCNGATVGSILGMKNGIDSIPEDFIVPFNGELMTEIVSMGKVKIDDIINKTIEQLQQ